MSDLSLAASRYEALVDREHVWTEKDLGTNAIAGITTDPAKTANRALRGMEALSMVAPTQIPRVKQADFEPYIRGLEPVIDKYTSNKILGTAAIEGAPMLGSLEQQLESGSFIDLIMATERILVDTTKSKYKPDRTAHRRLLAAHAPPLDTVPDLFFSPTFNLGDPATFSQVYEKSDFSKLSLADVNLTSTLLQDKLGVFCDTVDVYLVKEISKRSASFFNALSTLQALHLETQSCIDQIHTLRGRMASLTETTIEPGLAVSRLHTRRKNVEKLHDSVRKIFRVQSNLDVVDALIRQKQFGDAIELVEDLLGELKDLVDFPGQLEESKAPETSVGLENRHSLTEKATVAVTIETALPENHEGEPNLVHHLHKELIRKSHQISLQMDTEFTSLLLHEVREIVAQVDAITYISPAVMGTATEIWLLNIVRRKCGQDIPKEGSTESPVPPHANEGLMAQLSPIVSGLIRINRLSVAIQQYKESVMKEIKAITKKKYPEPPADVVGASRSPLTPTTPSSPSKKEMQNILAKQLRQMSFDSFLDLLVSVYTLLLHIFHKTKEIHTCAVSVITRAEAQGVHIGTNMSAPNSQDQLATSKKVRKDDDDDDFGSGDLLGFDHGWDTSQQDKPDNEQHQKNEANGFTQLVAESNDVLLAISEAANARCAKLLGVRSDQNAKLSPKDFYRLLGATKEFIAASEFLCGYHCINLKGALLSQAKHFLNHFHDERTKQLTSVIENEQWSRAEIPIDFQHFAEEICVAGVLAADKKKEGVRDDDELDDSDLAALVIAHKEAAAAASEDELVNSGKALKVGKETYYVAGCILLLTKMLTEYLACIQNMPSLVTEILNKTVDLLKSFNTKVRQAILGAGATRSAGLKAINAGHIGLTSQSLGAILGYISHLKAAFDRYLTVKQNCLLEDFDKLLNEYTEHQTALHDKLVSIMHERLMYHAQNLLNVNWDAPDSKDMASENTYTVHIAGLIKETTSMYRVLTKFLPKTTVQQIMGRIFKIYNESLAEELKNIEIYTSGGKNRLLMDGQHLISELSSLDNVDGMGNSIEVAINNVRIRDKSEKKSASTSTAPSTTSTSSATAMPSASSTATGSASSNAPVVGAKKNLFAKWKD
ncbi:hypothetical protein HDU83_004173 [Entophlyctis luteolus]|nr:hypothetical protein HDU83_004173 [Entophlyctis luteolus]